MRREGEGRRGGHTSELALSNAARVFSSSVPCSGRGAVPSMTGAKGLLEANWRVGEEGVAGATTTAGMEAGGEAARMAARACSA